MRNIKYMGTYEKEEQILRGYLPVKAVIFKESEDINKAILPGFLIALPVLFLMMIGFIYIIVQYIEVIIFDNFTLKFILTSIVAFAMQYVHEIIHALYFPKEYDKEIWFYPKNWAMFVYSDGLVKKKQWIWISLAPNVILGLLPYIVGFVTMILFPTSISFFVVFFGMAMTACGVGDYYNVYNAIRQVPKDAKIFNYGMHSYWIREES